MFLKKIYTPDLEDVEWKKKKKPTGKMTGS